MAPAAHRLLVALGKQIVHRVHACRIQRQQRHRTGIVVGLQIRQRGLAWHSTLRWTDTLRKPGRQRGTSAGIVGIQYVMLKIDRDKLGRAAALVFVRAAVAELIFAAPHPPRPHLPTGKIAQARIARQSAMCTAIEHMRQFVYQRRHRCARGWRVAIGTCIFGLRTPHLQQRAIEQDTIADCTAMYLRRQIGTPLQLDRCGQPLRPALRQSLGNLLHQCVARLYLSLTQVRRNKLDQQFGLRLRCDQGGQQQPTAPPAQTHWARMDCANSRSLDSRAASLRRRNCSSAASRRALRMTPSLATKPAAS